MNIYADLFDAEVTRVLDIHAPLRTGRRRCSGQHDTYFLSDEARQAKRRRRRLERRYRRSGLQSDKQAYNAYNAACKSAWDSIMTSRADHIKTAGASVRRHPGYMAHGTDSAAQPAEGRP